MLTLKSAHTTALDYPSIPIRESSLGSELIFAVMRTLSAVGAEQGLKTVGWKEYQELKDDRLAELNEAIFEFAHFLADLMAVDGALVLTAARDIIGFGAEIHVPTAESEVTG